MNRLANLQILDSIVNNEKSDTPFDEWLDAKYSDATARGDYLRTHFIPDTVSFEFEKFISFVEEREELLKKKIGDAFPSDFDKLVSMYALTDKLV